MSIWKLFVFTLHVTISLMANTMCQFPEDLEFGIVNSKEIKSVSGKTDASKGKSPVLPTGTKLINIEVSYDCT